MERPLAAVTGGTGFLGGHIVDALLADGWRVRALVRRRPVDARWAGAPVEVVGGDLAERESLERLCAGASAVVHAAGAIKARRASTFTEVNVAGASRLASAAKAAAPGAAVVLVSSLAARQPELSPYARSKQAGEEAMHAVVGGSLRVARPCALYGPGDRATLALFRAAATSPVLPVLGAAARVCLMHGADAARAVAALARDSARPGVVELSDARPQGYGWREIMATAAEAAGARPRLMTVPAAALRAAGLAGNVARWLGASPLLTSAKVREVLHADWSVGATPSPARPEFDLPEGFRNTVAWYRQRGWLAPAPGSL